MKYVFKIAITGITDPTIWRRVEVSSDYTFKRFHRVIQVAFGWENLHSFVFYEGETKDCLHIFMPHEDDIAKGKDNMADASTTKLKDIFSDNFKHLTYSYDSNDNWIHEITLEEIKDNDIKRPHCTEGEGMCPPEGCGGVQEYEHIKMIFREKPDSDEARRCREWLFMEDDEILDPDYFTEAEIEEINDIFERYFK